MRALLVLQLFENVVNNFNPILESIGHRARQENAAAQLSQSRASFRVLFEIPMIGALRLLLKALCIVLWLTSVCF